MKVRKALFPAAGMGTRFLPITKAIPKEMLPLVDKPLIQYCVEEAMGAAIKEIIIITGMGKTAIEDHFDTSFQLETILKDKGKLEELKVVQDVSNMLHFSYTRQKEAKGLGHAVLVGKNLIGNEPFAVFLGDDIVNAAVPCMKQMIDVYNEKGCSILAVKKVPRDEVSQYGVIAGEKVGDRLYRVLDMVEKPSVEDAPSDLAIIGRYLLMPEIFDHIEATPPGRGGEIQLTDAMKSLLKDQPMYALEFEGDRYDAGDRLGFVKANIAFALEREELRDDVVKFIKGLNLK